MDDAARQNERIERALALVGTARELRARLQKLAALRSTVRPRAWDRVHADYVARLESVMQELAPLREALERSAAQLRNGLAALEAKLRELSESSDELVLRHHIGELEDAAYRSASLELDTRRAATQNELEEVRRSMERLSQALGGEERPSAGAAARDPRSERAEVAALAANVAGGPGDGGAIGRDTVTFAGPLLVVGDGASQTTVRLGFGSCVIGSAPGCDVPLLHQGVRPEHAVISFQHDHHVLEAKGPLEHNGRPCKETPLAHGDRIRVGETEMIFVQLDALAPGGHLSAEDAQRTFLTPRAIMEEAARPAEAETSTVMYVAPVLVVKRAGLERRFKLDFGSKTIGTASGCDILVAADPGVMGRHAAVHFEHDHYVVIAAHPVKVNGKLASRAVLADGDAIEVGRTEIVFRIHGDAERAR